jgi:hypothetical protein
VVEDGRWWLVACSLVVLRGGNAGSERRQGMVKVTRRLQDPSFIRVWCPRIVLACMPRMTPVVARLGLGAGSRVGWVRVGYWASAGASPAD